MEHLIQAIARHWDFSPAQYWHWRMLSAVMLGPLLGVLYLVFVLFRKRTRTRRARQRQLRATVGPARTRWAGGPRRLLP